MKFKDVLNRKGLEKPKMPVGSPIVEIKKWRYNEDGDFVHVVTKKENLYEQIQAERDGTDLKMLLARYEAGDDTALNKVQGMFFDMKGMPKNYHELYAAVSSHNEVFDSMPAQLKEKFDNNPAKFWHEYGTKEFDEFVNDFRSAIYEQYGIMDPQPVNTSGEIKSEPVVEKPVQSVDKVGDMNE